MATKKSASKKATTAKSSAKKSASSSSSSSPSTQGKRQKDPEGGLTAAGRKAFAEKDGAHLRPGVQGPADTPEKMKRKGSFLRRHFANPRGPMERDGEPTRLALSAHAWGEPVPKTKAAAKKLATKGRKLLERFHEEKDKGAEEKSGSQKKTAAKKSSAIRSSSAKKSRAEKSS